MNKKELAKTLITLLFICFICSVLINGIKKAERIQEQRSIYQEREPEFQTIGDPPIEPTKDNLQYVYDESLHFSETTTISIYYYRDSTTNLMYMLTVHASGYGTEYSLTPYYKTKTEVYTYQEFRQDKNIPIFKMD